MTAREDWRPPFCPDPTGCSPLIHPLTDSDNMTLDQRGFAVFCFGRLAEPLTWTFDGVEHRETLSTCQSSPLKGVVRWLENESDWSALLRSYRAAITAAGSAEKEPEPHCDFDCAACHTEPGPKRGSAAVSGSPHGAHAYNVEPLEEEG